MPWRLGGTVRASAWPGTLEEAKDTSPHRNAWDRAGEGWLGWLRRARATLQNEKAWSLDARTCRVGGAGSAFGPSRCRSCSCAAAPGLGYTSASAQALLRPGTTVALWQLAWPRSTYESV